LFKDFIHLSVFFHGYEQMNAGKGKMGDKLLKVSFFDF